jgi:hypothetical protein
MCALTIGSEEPDAIGPEGYQKFFSELDVDMDGVRPISKCPSNNRHCLSLYPGGWGLRERFVSLVRNGFEE